MAPCTPSGNISEPGVESAVVVAAVMITIGVVAWSSSSVYPMIMMSIIWGLEALRLP